MGAMVPFIDIIIFAVIAVLLVVRLRSVLGQRSGYEQPQGERPTNRFDDNENDSEVIPLHAKATDDAPATLHGLDALRQIDRNFSEKEFIVGAKSATGPATTVSTESVGWEITGGAGEAARSSDMLGGGCALKRPLKAFDSVLNSACATDPDT